MSLESLAYRSNNQSIKQSIDSIDHMFHIGEIFRNFNHQQKKIWIKTLSFFSISAFINLFIFSFSWQKKIHIWRIPPVDYWLLLATTTTNCWLLVVVVVNGEYPWKLYIYLMVDWKRNTQWLSGFFFIAIFHHNE